MFPLDPMTWTFREHGRLQRSSAEPSVAERWKRRVRIPVCRNKERAALWYQRWDIGLRGGW